MYVDEQGAERDTSDAVTFYIEAAGSFSQLVDRIDASAWDGRGLGVWDLRALVGHTSRALTTVLSYLDQPSTTEHVDSPQRYYALAARHSTDSHAVAERGRSAGEQLGALPALAVQNLVKQVTTQIQQADPDALISSIGGGMRVYTYLPTRTFELVVHGLDIAATTGLDASFSPAVVGHAAELATRVAVELGEGTAVLTALTGRQPLPESFSVIQ